MLAGNHNLLWASGKHLSRDLLRFESRCKRFEFQPERHSSRVRMQFLTTHYNKASARSVQELIEQLEVIVGSAGFEPRTEASAGKWLASESTCMHSVMPHFKRHHCLPTLTSLEHCRAEGRPHRR
jgi:hypothetical protein